MKTKAFGVLLVALALLGCIQDGAYASPTPTYAGATATIGATPTPSTSPVPSGPAEGETCPDGTACPAGTSCAARCTDTVGRAPDICDYGCVPTVAPTASPTNEPTPLAGGKPTATPIPSATPRPIGASATEIPFERMNENQYISHRTAATYVFNDAPSWDRFRNSVPSNDPEGRNVLPEVDFTQKTVVAAFSGMKTSGGYTTQVMRIVEEPDRVAVVVQETSPGNCLVTYNITYPGDIVTVQKTGKPVDFIFEHLSMQCNG